MSESASRSPGRRSALLLVAAAALALTACGQAPVQAESAGITSPGSGDATSAEGSDAADPVDAPDVEVEGDPDEGEAGAGDVGTGPGGPVPTETTTEEITGPVARLEVSTDMGLVTVRGTDDAAVTVTRRIHREPDAPEETVRHEGDLLRIESDCPVDAPRGPCRIDYEITVPRATAVALGGASGDLAASGLTGPLSARTASGQVLLADHRAATTAAESVSGDVEVRLTNRPEAVEATSVSGNVRVVLPDAGPYRVRTATVTGDEDVDVRTDPGAPATIRASTTSGDITVGTG
jgi:putative adhesin